MDDTKRLRDALAHAEEAIGGNIMFLRDAKAGQLAANRERYDQAWDELNEAWVAIARTLAAVRP